ncbi:MAG TPA: glycosyltransferase family 4 protein, partial [Bacteroidota bacterium]
KDPFHRWVYGQLDQVFAISEVIRKNLIETCPLPSTKVEVLHDGVDLDLFSPTRVNTRRIRKEFNVGHKRFLIGMVGRFSPGKGHEDFLGALKILREKHPQVMALIAGEASHGEHEYEERIRSLASQMGLDDIVVFTGFRKDIPDIMASLDLFVFPSHAEAFGDVVIEAMAMQKPIVSTNCDGVTDIVVDGETGIQVPPRDPNALARAIALLAKDNRRRERYGKAGRERVKTHFNLKLRTSYLIKTYERLLKEKLKG